MVVFALIDKIWSGWVINKILKPYVNLLSWISPSGRQLTIFNTQATVAIGGSDRGRPFQGQLSGLYYNGLKVLSMAAEANPNIKINGSVRLVGDVPSVGGSARTTAMAPEMSTAFIETTTMMSTTTSRKHSSTVQVWIQIWIVLWFLVSLLDTSVQLLMWIENKISETQPKPDWTAKWLMVSLQLETSLLTRLPLSNQPIWWRDHHDLGIGHLKPPWQNPSSPW